MKYILKKLNIVLLITLLLTIFLIKIDNIQSVKADEIWKTINTVVYYPKMTDYNYILKKQGSEKTLKVKVLSTEKNKNFKCKSNNPSIISATKVDKGCKIKALGSSGSALITASSSFDSSAKTVAIVGIGQSSTTITSMADLETKFNNTIKKQKELNICYNTYKNAKDVTPESSMNQCMKLNSGISTQTSSNLNNKKFICKKSVSVKKGKIVSVKCTPAKGDKIIKYKSSKSSVATVTQQGKVKGIKKGKTKIIVTTKKSRKKTIKVTVTNTNKKTTSKKTSIKVKPAKKGTINIGGFGCYSSVTVTKGKTKSLGCSTPKSDPIKKYKSSNTKVATVTQQGKVKGIKKGNATITVTTKSGKTKKVKIKVNNKKSKKDSEWEWEIIDSNSCYSSVMVKEGKTKSLGCTFEKSNPVVSYSSSNTKIATVSSGNVKGIKKGTATITVKTKKGKTEKVKITVKKDNPNAGVNSLLFNSKGISCSSSVNVSVGSKKSLDCAIGDDENVVSYKSSNTKIATAGSGKVKGIKKGNATITVTVKSGKKAKIKVTVTTKKKKNSQETNDEITEEDEGYEYLHNESIVLAPKEKLKLSDYDEITPETKRKYLKYKSSNTSIVKINSNNEMIGVNSGTANIKVIYNDGTEKLEVGKIKVDVYNKEYPNYYSSVDKGYVTSVKNQHSIGICWTFSTNANIETYMIKNKSKYFDLSERFLQYSIINEFADNKINPYGIRSVTQEGGTYKYSADVYINNRGPISESKMPYEENQNIIDISKIQNYNQEININSILLAENVNGNNCTNNIDYMKSLVEKYGSVGVLVNTLNSNNGNIYSSVYTGTNHTVLIVGWDDNYPKTMFENPQPKNNGAWIVKNSWGTQMGYKGYYYVSYEDMHVCKNVFTITDANTKIPKHTYISSPSASARVSINAAVANLYKTKKSYEVIKQIKLGGGVEPVDIYIQSDVKTGSDLDINKATLVAKNVSSSDIYYTVDISNKKIVVNNGFAVILKGSNSETTQFTISDSNYYPNYDFKSIKSYTIAPNENNKLLTSTPYITVETDDYDGYEIKNVKVDTNEINITKGGSISMGVQTSKISNGEKLSIQIFDTGKNDYTSKFVIINPAVNNNETNIKINAKNASALHVGGYYVNIKYGFMEKTVAIKLYEDIDKGLISKEYAIHYMNETFDLPIKSKISNQQFQKLNIVSSDPNVVKVNSDNTLTSLIRGLADISAVSPDGKINYKYSVRIIDSIASIKTIYETEILLLNDKYYQKVPLVITGENVDEAVITISDIEQKNLDENTVSIEKDCNIMAGTCMAYLIFDNSKINSKKYYINVKGNVTFEGITRSGVYTTSIEMDKYVPATSISAYDDNIPINSEAAVQFTLYPKDASIKHVSYFSDNSDIVSVNSDGIMYGKSVGTAYITVFRKFDGANLGYVKVTVTDNITSKSTYILKNNNVLKNVSENTNSKTLESNLNLDSTEKITVYDKDGKEINKENIGTGSKVIRQYGDNKKEYYIVVNGDVDGDGKVRSNDILLAKKYLDSLNENQKEALDINGDGKILTSDLIKIQKYIVR